MVTFLDDKNINKTPIGSIGEFGLIDRLSSNVELKNKSTIKGIGDDTAVMISLHADAVIHEVEKFKDSIREAVAIAKEGSLALIGIIFIQI